MGFDGFDPIELVMSVEDNLNITIPDKDGEKLITAGDLLAYLIRRLNAAPAPANAVCRSARIFRETRKSLAARLGVNPRRIRPSTLTEDLLPPPDDLESRRSAWDQIRESVKIAPGKLQAPRKIQTALNLVFILSPAGLLLLTQVPREILPAILYLYLIACAVVLVSIYWLGRTFASELPNGFKNIGELIGQVRLSQIQDQPQILTTHWTHSELWELVQDLAAGSAGISPTRIKRDTVFMSL